jgi:hypothetical protein
MIGAGSAATSSARGRGGRRRRRIAPAPNAGTRRMGQSGRPRRRGASTEAPRGRRRAAPPEPGLASGRFMRGTVVSGSGTDAPALPIAGSSCATAAESAIEAAPARDPGTGGRPRAAFVPRACAIATDPEPAPAATADAAAASELPRSASADSAPAAGRDSDVAAEGIADATADGAAEPSLSSGHSEARSPGAGASGVVAPLSRSTLGAPTCARSPASAAGTGSAVVAAGASPTALTGLVSGPT